MAREYEGECCEKDEGCWGLREDVSGETHVGSVGTITRFPKL